MGSHGGSGEHSGGGGAQGGGFHGDGGTHTMRMLSDVGGVAVGPWCASCSLALQMVNFLLYMPIALLTTAQALQEAVQPSGRVSHQGLKPSEYCHISHSINIRVPTFERHAPTTSISVSASCASPPRSSASSATPPCVPLGFQLATLASRTEDCIDRCSAAC